LLEDKIDLSFNQRRSFYTVAQSAGLPDDTGREQLVHEGSTDRCRLSTHSRAEHGITCPPVRAILPLVREEIGCLSVELTDADSSRRLAA
jgi:hypothetical protein